MQAAALIGALQRHDLEFVLIGGLAAVLHGSPVVTQDADICPRRDPENLRRLAAALEALQARLRVANEPEGVEFPFDPAFLGSVEVLNLSTVHGDLDVSYTPSGTKGYDDLVMSAVPMDLGSFGVRVASLEDVIRSKEAANREKDRATLPLLRLHLRTLRERGSGGESR